MNPTGNSLRGVFDSAAQDYADVRPGYPEALIEDLVRESALPERGQILEIGCGTGLATRPFAQRGYNMLCLDIGRNMVELASRSLRAFEDVHFEVVSFEDWEPRGRVFDLVMSASAFHWIDSDVGGPKAMAVLKPTGAFAVFTHYHPGPHTGFFDEVQEVYRKVVPEWPDPRNAAPIEDLIARRTRELEETVANAVRVEQYAWSRTYSANQYVRLMNTYSGHRALPDGRREELFHGVETLILDSYGGSIERPYLSVLYLVMKQPG